MLLPFLLTLREAIQAALIILVLLQYPALKARGQALALGLTLGLLAGAGMSYIAPLAGLNSKVLLWGGLRQVFEALLLYSGLLALIVERDWPDFTLPSWLEYALAFVLGLGLCFFEARAAWFFLQDYARTQAMHTASAAGTLLGLGLGLLPLFLLMKPLGRLRPERLFSLPSVLVAAGVIKLATGGVGEVEQSGLFLSLSEALHEFVQSAVAQGQGLLMITAHKFIAAPLGGLAGYVSEDRVSTAILLVFFMAPPVAVLWDVFSRPDPYLKDLAVAAERRLKLAFFRKEMILLSAPLLLGIITLTVLIHSAGGTLNPLTEPEAMAVSESEAIKGEIHIPLSDRLGEFTDGKLRKYFFPQGGKKITFIAIMKPDGSVGVALDECEICKPAEWNTAALGYAQRGDHLVCKYCMTPIPIPTVNEPGGCNPIPVTFHVAEDYIAIPIAELVRVYGEAKSLSKKGTHF